MPIVHVYLAEGRSVDQKRALAEGITNVVSRVLGVAPEPGVHVLIHDMSRSSWSRGGTLVSERNPAVAATVGMGLAFYSVSEVRVAEGQLDEYLSYRRDHVNPAMATMPRFHTSILARDLADERNYLVFNGWDAEQDWRHYQGTPVHDELKKTVRGDLTQSMSIDRCTLLDLPNGGGLNQEPEVPQYMTVSTHRVRPEKTSEYMGIRHSAVNPGMAALDGFISTSLLQRDEAKNEFLVVNQWTSRDASEAYRLSDLHDGLKPRVRALLDNHSGTKEYETVVLR